MLSQRTFPCSSLQDNLTTLGTKKYNIAETQDKDFKIAIMNMLKDLKDESKTPQQSARGRENLKN